MASNSGGVRDKGTREEIDRWVLFYLGWCSCDMHMIHDTCQVYKLTPNTVCSNSYKHVCSKSLRYFFFQNNTHFQTISLVNKVSKLFRKLAYQVFKTRIHCSNSTLSYSSSMHWQWNSSLKDTSPLTTQISLKNEAKSKPGN